MSLFLLIYRLHKELCLHGGVSASGPYFGCILLNGNLLDPCN